MVSQPGDPTAEDGNLYPLDEAEALDPGDAEGRSDTTPVDAGAVFLRSNTAIQEDEISGFRMRTRMETVVLIGEHKAGKSTLLAAIYGLFCKGPIGAIEFVSSETLFSFAQRNHLAIFDAKRATASTPRTSIGEGVGYFHLRLRRGEAISDLVIADRSGEAFETARVNTALLDKVTELALADRVCFLLDAARLTNVQTRHGYRRIFKQTIRALLDNNKIPPCTAIEVLVTKVDRLSRPVDGRDLPGEVAEYKAELTAEFAQKGRPFDIYEICALPRSAVRIGFVGMNELIDRWAGTTTKADISPRPVDDALRYIDRMPGIWS